MPEAKPWPSDWKVEHDPIYGCMLWAGSIDRDGYGILWRKGGPTQAHRTIYRELVGPVLPGLKLDHLCRRRNCVRPDHLEPVSESTNQLRRKWSVRLRQIKCAAGHSLEVHGMVTSEGGRLCRICQGPPREQTGR